jgi:hypothetical protein
MNEKIKMNLQRKAKKKIEKHRQRESYIRQTERKNKPRRRKEGKNERNKGPTCYR